MEKQRAEAAKQRHFAEQQRRLQEIGSHGPSRRKLNADTLIDSILGRSDAPSRQGHAVSMPPAANANASEPDSSMTGLR